jgi:hypothetical protein
MPIYIMASIAVEDRDDASVIVVEGLGDPE